MDELQGHERKFLEQLAVDFEVGYERPPQILDVGANVGQYAKACKEIWPECGVVCFEPNEGAFMELTQNLGQVDGISFYKVALSNVRDLKEFHYGSGDDQSASLHKRILPGVGQLHPKSSVVQTVRLDELDLDLTNVDLLKLDVEGHELHVLEGAGPQLNPMNIRVVQWEFNSCALDSRIYMRDFWRLLQGRGYDILQIFSDGHWEWIEEYDTDLEDFTAHREFCAVEAE